MTTNTEVKDTGTEVMSNMDPMFKPIAEAVKTANKKNAGTYGSMAKLTLDCTTTRGMTTAEALKDFFKAQEKAATVELRVKMGENSTYRVVKGLMLKAVELGISLVRADGDIKGKTELEEEILAAKPQKSPLDKFKIAMNTAGAVAKDLTDEECITAAALLNSLLVDVSKRIKLAA